MKLQLKHLAPYLPYGLKGMRIDYDSLGEHELAGLTIWDIITSRGKIDYKYFKPLLHPLSRLTELILKDDNTPIDYFQEKYYTLGLDSQCKRILEDERWINQCDWLLIQYLFEWHFDVFNLIEKGLAEPIETSKAKGE